MAIRQQDLVGSHADAICDWRDEITSSPGTESYFAEIDRRFLSSAVKLARSRDITSRMNGAERPKICSS